MSVNPIEVGERLARIETKLDSLVGQNGRVAKIESTLRFHDKIIWSVSGAAAILGYLIRGFIGD
jgi:hypothetical protein